jgi:hypothetical protein
MGGADIMIPVPENSVKKNPLWEWLTSASMIHDEEMLYEMIRETREDIDLCRRNYEFTNDETLIDMYIYAIKAHEMRYKYLLQIAKRFYDAGGAENF